MSQRELITAMHLHKKSPSRLSWSQLGEEAKESFLDEARAYLRRQEAAEQPAVKVLDTRTTYGRTLVLHGAPRIVFRGVEYQPTAITYHWWTAQPVPSSVDVVVRKIKKDGTVGSSTSVVAYELREERSGWELAPQWIRDLVTTD